MCKELADWSYTRWRSVLRRIATHIEARRCKEACAESCVLVASADESLPVRKGFVRVGLERVGAWGSAHSSVHALCCPCYHTRWRREQRARVILMIERLEWNLAHGERVWVYILAEGANSQYSFTRVSSFSSTSYLLLCQSHYCTMQRFLVRLCFSSVFQVKNVFVIHMENYQLLELRFSGSCTVCKL